MAQVAEGLRKGFKALGLILVLTNSAHKEVIMDSLTCGIDCVGAVVWGCASPWIKRTSWSNIGDKK